MNRRLLGLAVPFLTGCPTEVVETGDEVFISFSSGVQLMLIMIPVAIIVACGALAFWRPARLIAILTGLGVALLSGLIIPGARQDQVRIDAQEIFQTTGFWFSPTRKGFRFDEVDHVRIVVKRLPRAKRPSNIWELVGRDGSVRDLDPGDLWDDNAAMIQPLLEKRGVRFER